MGFSDQILLSFKHLFFISECITFNSQAIVQVLKEIEKKNFCSFHSTSLKKSGGKRSFKFEIDISR